MSPATVLETMRFDRKKLTNDQLLKLYMQLVYPRMIEERMLLLLRQGKVSKWFSGIGQEAISVGTTAALLPDEMIFTMHRNLGVFTTREVPLDRLYLQWQGKEGGFTKGRDRSFHFGAPEYGIVGMISHLGPQLSLAGGVALAHNIRKAGKVSMAFTGEGGTSQGEFHEALNVAAVWNLPVLFIIENNQYGLSTPTSEQYRCENLADRGIGYGMESHILDGNNMLEVYNTLTALTADMRKNPRPVLIEMKTFRVRGHEEASGTKYVPGDLQKAWAAKDPILNFERFLIEEGILTNESIEKIKADYKKQISAAADAAFKAPPIESTLEAEMADVYRPNTNMLVPAGEATTNMRFVDAISDGLRQAMRKHDNLVLMGQDIAEYGGVFKITDGFVAEFGKDRVRNTPLCESAIVGCALGLSLEGMKAMVEMQFADFVTCGFNQIINNLAKLNYRWGGSADVVIRMPTGAGTGAGPFHSQSNEAWFTHTPGLKVVYPSTPADAKGMLLAAIADPNPVMFFEHKAIYRQFSGDVPDGYYTLPIGQARIVRPGEKLSLITYGMGVHWAIKAVEELSLDAEIIDLRSLAPIDYDTIAKSVRKTNRALVLNEDTMTGSICNDLAAWIGENLFEHLDAPIMRVASLDMPIPFAGALEKIFLPEQRLRDTLVKLSSW
jgi:2-oxoisovalerate dehydrogenase E1 component